MSVREVARSVGMRQQSLTYYFPTKQALLDALFADGFAALRRDFDALPEPTEPEAGVVDVAVSFVDYCVNHPARYHLMFQRTTPAAGCSPIRPAAASAGSSRRSVPVRTSDRADRNAGQRDEAEPLEAVDSGPSPAGRRVIEGGLIDARGGAPVRG